ncbi:MAG: ATP synthase subunit I [Syntrophales bacterium]|nr:ATP synthase subunit I [Syntrophales bacterium]
MNDIAVRIVFSFFMGVCIGLFFFGGLWWTVRRIAKAGRPSFLIIVSFALRAGLALFVIYLIAGGQLEKTLSALSGLIAARILMIRHMGRIMQYGSDEFKGNQP